MNIIIPNFIHLFIVKSRQFTNSDKNNVILLSLFYSPGSGTDPLGKPAEYGKNCTVGTADRRQALTSSGLCPIEVHLNQASG